MKSAILVLPLIAMQTLPFSATAMPPHTPVPGGVAVIELPEATNSEVWFGEQRTLVSCNDDACHAIVGIPLATEPGRASIRVRDAQGAVFDLGFDVEDKHLLFKSARSFSP